MKFRKYEFTNTQWTTQKSKIWNEETGYTNCHVVELGNLVTTPGVYDAEGNQVTAPVLSSKFSVDILWTAEPEISFTQYEVWPEPCGIHTFAGLEGLYEQDYKEKFPS